jgi:hypothetical protein
MESRIIYECDKTYLDRIHWLKTEKNTESEWCYLNPKNLTENDVEKIFVENFGEENFYLVVNRNESIEISKMEIFSKLNLMYGKSEFRIWSKDFENVVEFKTEVYRKGKKASR